MLCVALLGMVWYVISEARIAKEVRDSRVLVARLRNLVELRCKFSGILKGFLEFENEVFLSIFKVCA
jgi:hypothetical protein